MSARVRIKVCCIANAEEARRAVAAGADALGLVAEMPSGPGPIPDATIRSIARGVAPTISTFLLTSRTEPQDVVEHAQECETSVVQLVDLVPFETYAVLRRTLPALKIVQVVHVEDLESLQYAQSVAAQVDAVLLDSGRPSAGSLGGTGNVHDWSISARIVAALDVPVFLAGGLKPSNVKDAISTVRPFGVDLCSGVRTEGQLDAAKLHAFVAACRP